MFIGFYRCVKANCKICDRDRPMTGIMRSMPIEVGRPTCRAVAPSAPSELAWLLNLLVQDARYAEPALAEPEPERPAIMGRLRTLRENARTRHAYRDILAEVWQLASSAWDHAGRAAVVDACVAWNAKLGTGASIEDLVPPRHPLTRADRLGFDDLFEHRNEFAVSPLYFCLSGGHVIDLYELVHIAVPASDLLPVRRVRDAMFVSDRLRVLAEPTRVHILIQLFSAPSSVMELSRSLRMSQPTVSGHLKILRDAGLVQPRRFGVRTVMVPSRRRVERLIEDARATLARWD